MGKHLPEETLRSAQHGDRGALRTLYHHLAPSTLGYLRGKNVDDPEAVMQEVLLSVFSRLAGLEGGEASLRTLTFSIAHARVVDHLRRSSRKPAEAEYDPDHDFRTSPSAESVALNSLKHSDVLVLMGELNINHREVLLLRIVAELPVDEVASIMGRSVGATKQLQKRALESLRDLAKSRRNSI